MINAKNLQQHSQGLERLTSDDLALSNFAPIARWSEMNQGEHFAQFYETDRFLLASLRDFVKFGLSAGETVIVACNHTHADGLKELLAETGVDLIQAQADSRLFLLDAATLLARFMVNLSPDPALFEENVASFVKKAIEVNPAVRIFGEMVSVLWEAGNYDAAIKLEGFWNELQKRHQFLLYCAYPLGGFANEAFSSRLKDVCATHARIVPAESYIALNSPETRLRTILDLQQKAQALQAEIVERRKAEESLRHLKEELESQVSREQLARTDAEDANRMKDEFLATVSHELRTPLTAIIGWIHMLRSGSLDESTVSRALETIDRNAKVQAQLVEDILDVSRVITGKLRLNIEPVDVAAVINAAIDSVQLAAESKGIHLAVTLDPSARHSLGDAGRLQQVVWNLVSNAIKFTPTNGKVDVKLTRIEDGSLQICIRDTGQGIKPEFLPFIFDRFRQADGTITRQHGGLGLGLAIVRHLVELHGGSVHADSAGEGRGSTFTITLPSTVPRNNSRTEKRTTSSLYGRKRDNQLLTRASLENLRVLLVDDDEDTLQVLTIMLRNQKASVQTATSASEALEVFQWFKPQVIVSDLAMPDEDGFWLIRRIRSIEGDSPNPVRAVALTAYVRIEDRARALTAGFNMFVTKPVEITDLITAISSLSERQD